MQNISLVALQSLISSLIFFPFIKTHYKCMRKLPLSNTNATYYGSDTNSVGVTIVLGFHRR